MRLVVVVGDDHPGLDPRDLHGVGPVGNAPQVEHGLPQVGRILGVDEQLEPLLPREPRPAEPHGDADHLHALRDEPVVLDAGQIRIGHRLQGLPRPRALHLKVRHLLDHVVDADVQALGGLGELLGVLRGVRHDPHVVVGQLEDRAVVSHQSVVVGEGAVANLAHLQALDVVGVHTLGCL